MLCYKSNECFIRHAHPPGGSGEQQGVHLRPVMHPTPISQVNLVFFMTAIEPIHARQDHPEAGQLAHVDIVVAYAAAITVTQSILIWSHSMYGRLQLYGGQPSPPAPGGLI